MNLLQSNFLSYKEGDIIFQSGDKSDYLYLILDGEVKLKINSPGSNSTIREKEKNDFFGDFEVLDGTPRKSSAVANTDCVLYKLSQKELLDLISVHGVIKDTITAEKGDDTTFVKNNSYQIRQGLDGTGEAIIDAPAPYHEPDLSGENIEELTSDIQFEDSEVEFSNSEIISPESETIPLPEETPLTEASSLLAESSVVEEQQQTEEILPQEDKELTEEPVPAEAPLPAESKTPLLYDDEDLSGGSIFSAALNGDIEFADEPVIEETPVDKEIQVPEISGPEIQVPEMLDQEIPAPEATEVQSFTESVQDELDYKKILAAVQKIHKNTELDKIVHSILESILTLFDAQIARIFILDEVNHELWSFPFMDNSEEIRKVKIGVGLIGACAQDNDVINIKNPEMDARFNLQSDAVENIVAEDMLLFPVRDEANNVAAVVQMINSAKDGFNKLDEDTLQLLSSDICTAISKSYQNPDKTNTGNLYQLEKMADFFINEISTPLSLINRYAEFVWKKTGIKEIKQVSEFIIEQVKSISTYSDIIKDFVYEKNSLKGEALDLKTTLNSILDMFAEYVESKQTNLFKKIDAETTVFINADAFYHACFQIIKCICESVPEGGNIYILSQIDGGSISIEFLATGKGITEEIKNKLSKSFILHGNIENIGLSIANKLIKDF
ncbi:MAG: cyclic nucleotide-binding domain-containing protein, partial [Ignavibacteriaceae bacterium]|nr:cyclic nucleotide-binding domain-containing protein [Ignavibacteriaceae bacterium]